MLTPEQVEEKLQYDTLHPAELPSAAADVNDISTFQESGLFRSGEMIALNVHPTNDGPPLPNGIDPAPHRHEFIEISYVWKRQCDMYVEGKTFHMNSGDILFLDTKSAHRPLVPKGTLLINLLIQPSFFHDTMLRHFSSDDPLGSFFANSVYTQKATKRHLIFETQDDARIRQLFMMIMQEYFAEEILSKAIIENLISILFTTLVRLHRQAQIHITENTQMNEGPVTEILRYMQENLLTTTRDSVAEHFGYSYSYISTILQMATGQTFSKLRQSLKMQRAELLTRTTDLSISDVAHDSGFSNMSRFYEAFRDSYGTSPQEYRNQFLK